MKSRNKGQEQPMELAAFLENMTPAIHQALRQSLELGKWPDGRKMTEQERDAGLQAIIVYEHEHLPENQRIGYMPQSCKSGKAEKTEETILRFKDA